MVIDVWVRQPFVDGIKCSVKCLTVELIPHNRWLRMVGTESMRIPLQLWLRMTCTFQRINCWPIWTFHKGQSSELWRSWACVEFWAHGCCIASPRTDAKASRVFWKFSKILLKIAWNTFRNCVTFAWKLCEMFLKTVWNFLKN